MKKVAILLIVVLLVFSACTSPTTNEVVAKEETKQETKEEVSEEKIEKATPEPTVEPSDAPDAFPITVAVVVCRDGYAPGELHPVMDALAVAGYTPLVVSDEMGDAEAPGESTQINAVFSDFNGSALRGIVVIGGSASLWDNTELHRLINEVADLNRVTAGICLNSVALAKAGIIGEGDEACWFNCSIADPEMEAAGVVDSGKPVTVNGNIITGNGPPASEEFAAEVVAALKALG